MTSPAYVIGPLGGGYQYRTKQSTCCSARQNCVSGVIRERAVTDCREKRVPRSYDSRSVIQLGSPATLRSHTLSPLTVSRSRLPGWPVQSDNCTTASARALDPSPISCVIRVSIPAAHCGTFLGLPRLPRPIHTRPLYRSVFLPVTLHAVRSMIAHNPAPVPR